MDKAYHLKSLKPIAYSKRNKAKKMIMKRVKILRLASAAILVLLLMATSCSKEDNGSDYDPPADHTISKSGYLHKDGLNNPQTNCITCHGSDLKGGTSGVSCFECHGTKW